MFDRMKSWRTSLVGMGALIYAIADLVVMVHNKTWDGAQLGTDVLAILTGLGFVVARDNAASVQQHACQTQEIEGVKAEAVVAKAEAVVAAKTAVTLAEKVEEHIEKNS